MRETLGHFTLIEEIGAGGMGVVYRAHDPRLDRDVAIKVLPAGTLADLQARKRFRHEALALSRLAHPNIAVVHDFNSEDGVDFLVMELVPGTTLDERIRAGPLAQSAIVELGLQLADALTAAHQQGIVHRDLKPGNLRVTPDGRLKVLDFGLAQTLHVSSTDATKSIEFADSTSGTLPYMAPEQLRNETPDQRTDIWAAGAVLYELATGSRPFRAGTAPALAGEILHTPVRPPRHLNGGISPELERIILRCLVKDRSHRYASAGELATELRNLQAARPTALWNGLLTKPVVAGVSLLLALVLGILYWTTSGGRVEEASATPIVAVLPLENLSGSADEQYLVDGVTDALITELARIRPLRVIARGSVVRAQTEGKTPAEIAGELHADVIVEGSVRRSGQRVQVAARLIDPSTNTSRWAQTYEREVKDLLTVQHEIASAIGSELAASPAATAAPRNRQVDPEAHEAYLRGRHFWSRRGLEDLKTAISYFEQATQKDPGYAPAHAGLADAYVSLYDYGYLSAADVTTKIRTSARRALELDARSAEAHASLGHLALHDWDWAESEKQFREAIAIDPSYVTAYHWYSLGLTALGRTGEAVAAMQQAQRLDPLSVRINADLGMALLADGKFDAAIEQEKKALELRPGLATATWIQGMAYQQKRMLPEAIEKYREALTASPGNPNFLAALGHAYGEAERPDEARLVLLELEAVGKKRLVSPFFIALVHVGLGENREALNWLEKAYEERSGSIRYLKVEPRLKGLRGEPQMQDMMRRVGLADK